MTDLIKKCVDDAFFVVYPWWPAHLTTREEMNKLDRHDIRTWTPVMRLLSDDDLSKVGKFEPKEWFPAMIHAARQELLHRNLLY